MGDKSNLNLYCQKKHIPTPVYCCESTSEGFSCTVTIEDTEYCSLTPHSTKKEAEKDAASVALRDVLANYPSTKSIEELLDGLKISGPTRNPPPNSPSAPVPLGGHVVDSVYYPSSGTPSGLPVTTPLGLPITTPPGLVLSPRQHLTTPSIPPLVMPPIISLVAPRQQEIPISIDGPSLNTPSTATPLPIRGHLTSEPSGGPPPLISVRPTTQDKDIKELEVYCQASNLPLPVYTIYQEKGKHVGKVRVGEMEFSRSWGYDSFNDAKDSAAIVAIAGIAMIQLQLLTQSQGASVCKSAPPLLCPVQLSANHPPSVHATPPANGLQTPSYFQQQLIPRGPSQSAPTPPVVMTTDYKSQLNTHCQQSHILPPVYNCTSPSDKSGYISTVTVSGRLYRSSVHGTKKAADTEAAQLAAEALGVASNQEVRSVPPPRNTTSPPPAATFVSYKNRLQERAQKEKVSHPQYSTERAGTGFVSTVTVHSATGPAFTLSSSAHPVKKIAEQEAARKACEKLNLL